MLIARNKTCVYQIICPFIHFYNDLQTNTKEIIRKHNLSSYVWSGRADHLLQPTAFSAALKWTFLASDFKIKAKFNELV